MPPSVLICLADGCEEIETVTTADLLVRAGIQVTLASANNDGGCLITGSRGIRLQADLPLVRVADEPFDAIVLPGGLKGAENLRDSPLVIEKTRRMQCEEKIVAAICAAPSVILVAHQLFPLGNMTGYPALQDKIPAKQWVNQRVYFDERVNLLTSQGPATAIDFALRLIDCLCGQETAARVAGELVLPPGIWNYQDIPEWTPDNS